MSQQGSVGRSDKRVYPRVPLDAKVRINYPDRERLVTELCRDVSVGGMFVATATPPAVGSIVGFELDLEILQGRISGTGEVVWTQEGAVPSARGSGFGMRFVEIDPRHRQLIFRIVDRFVQRGGQPFDLENSG